MTAVEGTVRARITRLALPGVAPHAEAVPRLGRMVTAALWVLLVLFSLHGVFGRSLWGSNDTREGGMIWDMVRNGTWVTATINGTPFLEKPPLLHWTGVVVCRAAGKVTEGLLRLPAALYGLGTLVLLVLFVRGPRAPGETAPADGRELAAWAAALLCGTAVEFLEYARVVLTDMALVFVVMLALLLFWRAYLRPGTARWLAFLAAAAGAFYAKGLIGPALIWASVAVFLVWQRRFRLLAGLAVAYVPVVLLTVLPWVAALYRFGGEPALKFVFWDNQVGRFFTFANRNLPHDPFFINKEPWYYYLAELPKYLAPWTLLLVPALAAWVRRSPRLRTAFHALIASTLAGMALVLQASSAKVANYALPLYPFLFAAVALWLVDAFVHRRPTLLERAAVRLTAGAVALLLGLVPAVFVAGTFIKPRLFGVTGWPQVAAGIGGAVVALASLALAGLLLLRLLRSDARPLAVVAAPAAYVVVASTLLQLVTPVIELNRSYRPIAALAASEARNGVAVALGSREYHDVGAFTFYLDRRVKVLASGPEIAAFLRGGEPRAVVVPVETLPAVESELVGVPHARLDAGRPESVSRSYALLENRAGEVASRRLGGESAGAVAVARDAGARPPATLQGSADPGSLHPTPGS